jgi:hypothetical protein
MFGGYDIYDLPYEVRFKKAIPAILEEFSCRKLELGELKKYLYLKIGLG